MKIAFLGLGNMGAPMARNLVNDGLALQVYDVVPSHMEPLLELGATPCKTALEAVRGVDVVISMLPASAHVESLYLSPDASGQLLLDAIQRDSLIVECSTISPQTARRLAAAADERGLQCVDAPVSGGVGGAEQGTLTFMVGGHPEAVERARPIFEVLGSNMFHAGTSGAGQVAKICNNMLLAIHMTGTAEALALGVANGLDASVLSDIMRRSSGGNWSLEKYNPYPGVMDNVPAARDYQGGFLVDLMIKDLGLALEAADHVSATAPMGSLARNLYLLLRGRFGAGRLDSSSIQRLYADDV